MTQDADNMFDMQLHMLTEMGFNDSQANAEGKQI